MGPAQVLGLLQGRELHRPGDLVLVAVLDRWHPAQCMSSRCGQYAERMGSRMRYGPWTLAARDGRIEYQVWLPGQPSRPWLWCQQPPDGAVSKRVAATALPSRSLSWTQPDSQLPCSVMRRPWV
jgi:hypothetical protein